MTRSWITLAALSVVSSGAFGATSQDTPSKPDKQDQPAPTHAERMRTLLRSDVVPAQHRAIVAVRRVDDQLRKTQEALTRLGAHLLHASADEKDRARMQLQENAAKKLASIRIAVVDSHAEMSACEAECLRAEKVDLVRGTTTYEVEPPAKKERPTDAAQHHERMVEHAKKSKDALAGLDASIAEVGETARQLGDAELTKLAEGLAAESKALATATRECEEAAAAVHGSGSEHEQHGKHGKDGAR